MPDMLPETALRACRHLHITGWSLFSDPPRTAALYAAQIASASGATISFDPASYQIIREIGHDQFDRITANLPVDILFPNRDEGQALTGERDPQTIAAALRERLVIDISNPFDHLPDNRVAGAEVTRDAIGPGARVVAAFKTNFAATLLAPLNVDGVQRDVLFAGDDEEDKRIVAGLIADLGFRPVDCGVLHNARILDGMVPLIIELDRRYGGAWQTSWKLLP